MTPRPKIVAGNWKMFLRTDTARALASAVAAAAAEVTGPDVAVFPAAVHLAAVREALGGSRVALGGQTCHDRTEGAHTGVPDYQAVQRVLQAGQRYPDGPGADVYVLAHDGLVLLLRVVRGADGVPLLDTLRRLASSETGQDPILKRMGIGPGLGPAGAPGG